jgi:hypothetical protein
VSPGPNGYRAPFGGSPDARERLLLFTGRVWPFRRGRLRRPVFGPPPPPGSSFVTLVKIALCVPTNKLLFRGRGSGRSRGSSLHPLRTPFPMPHPNRPTYGVSRVFIFESIPATGVLPPAAFFGSCIFDLDRSPRAPHGVGPPIGWADPLCDTAPSLGGGDGLTSEREGHQASLSAFHCLYVRDGRTHSF